MDHELIGISRHRIGVDGEGVTTLVAYHGCMLRCRYCLNRRALRDDGLWRTMSTQQLIKVLRKDDIYFRATSGGITFGGGEPLLEPKRILYVHRYCPPYWKINVETSLNVPPQLVHAVSYVIDQWIVDIKDMNPAIYEAYTGHDNRNVILNLRYLVEQGARITVRVPLIPGCNTPGDVARSIALLKEMGITDIDQFSYIVKTDNNG